MKTRKLPRRDEIIALLASQRRALHAREIATQLEVAEGDYLRFLTLINEMAFDQAIRALPGQRYRAGKESLDLREGRLSVHPRGFGFVSVRGSSTDLFVPPEAIGPGMHGDIVQVRVMARTRRGEEARVEAVIERRNRRITGTLRKRGKSVWLEVDDPRLRGPVVLRGEVEGADGDTAVVEVVQFPEHPEENPEAVVLAVLGPPGTAAVETRKVLLRDNVVETFPAEVEAQVKGMGIELDLPTAGEREDLRDLPFFTIDPSDARDHDDAVLVRAIDGGWEAWIAIADVANFVPEGTAIDLEARQRAFSLYLPDRAVPMLPHELSSNLCSLLPDVDRLCIAVRVKVERSGKVRESSVCEAVMCSRAKLSYSGVAKAMRWSVADATTAQLPAELLEHLRVADELARVLRRKRLRRGALDLQIPEAQLVLDPQSGEPVHVQRRAEDPGIKRAYQLVEELMLLANEAMAEWMMHRSVPAIFRIHALPDETKLERLSQLCEALDIPFDVEDAADAKRLGSFLARVAEHPLASIIGILALRSLKQAAYDSVNIGHFGLASKAYLHFTSPIRRYPDLVVHRFVRRSLRKERATTELEEALHDVAMHCSKREREVAELEREVIDLYRAIMMRSRIGMLAAGRVMEIVGSGLIVTLDDPFVDVRVPEELLGDSYEASDDGLWMRGRRSGRRIALGDRVLVEVVDVNLSRRSTTGRLYQDKAANGPKVEAGGFRRPKRDTRSKSAKSRKK